MLADPKTSKTTTSPSNGPHCPTVAKTVYAPARFDSVAFKFDTQASSNDTEAKISTDKKIEKYLGPAPVVVALMMKPIAPSSAAAQQNGPRIWNLSDSQQNEIMVRNDRTYGGAERPWD